MHETALNLLTLSPLCGYLVRIMIILDGLAEADDVNGAGII
jgi:hypothetical protein